MRVLCVCRGGNVRSVTLGRLLRKRGHSVFTCGSDKGFARDGREMVEALAAWADVICAQADSRLTDLLPAELHSKIDLRYDVGPDDWKRPDHPDLLRRMRDLVEANPL